MYSITIRFIRLVLLLVVLAGSCPTQAAYQITSIDYPGVGFTEVLGINNSGLVVGISSISFTYDSRTGVFTPVPDDPNAVFSSVLGINEPGVMVGVSVPSLNPFTERGFLRNKHGTYTVFSKPGWDNTEPRAVSDTGLITGYAFDNAFTTTVGFIYDPADNTFIDILPGRNTLAQGINARGEVVGSVSLAAGVACTGCPAGLYGWLRAASGAITLFEVNGQATRARGISDSGLITGFVRDPISGHDKGFVVALVAGSSYQSLTVPDAELLEVPGAIVTAPQGITNSGEIVGIWLELDSSSTFFVFHGFIATPLPQGK